MVTAPVLGAWKANNFIMMDWDNNFLSRAGGDGPAQVTHPACRSSHPEPQLELFRAIVRIFPAGA